MANKRNKTILICTFSLCLLLSGCASMKGDKTSEVVPPPAGSSASKGQQPAAEQKKTDTQKEGQRPGKTVPEKPAQPPAKEPGRPPVQKPDAESDDYRKVLDEYAGSYRKNPRDHALAKEYAKKVEDIKSAADKAYGDNDFLSAGQTYDLLITRFVQFKGFAHMLTFKKPYLDQRLALCKRALSGQGFQEYRKGNLAEAITSWQSLLEIDPNNQDIKKAVKTATEQQKNLEKK